MLWNARLFIALLLTISSNICLAKPEATSIFCEKYAGTDICSSDKVSCNVCHAGPPSLNDFGSAVAQNIGGHLEANLISALEAVEDIDSDGDGINNGEEIRANAHPGDKSIQPSADINVAYDVVTAFKRMKAVFCGTSANYAELQSLSGAADSAALLHQALDVCLQSDYWVKEALHRIADKKILPNAALGFGGNVVIGDYRFDYRLFAYIMSGGRDARELLTADYHVDENYQKIEGRVSREEGIAFGGERIVIAGGQPLTPERRAGMLTTQWFISNNTMFAELPRNTASQAYRAYLGLDLAKGEGIMPVPGEPRDVDNKNIAQAECAVCHSTLDPLAYSFASYRGITTNAIELVFNPIGRYNEDQTPWGADGVIFGQPVGDLLEWAQVAVESDDFKKNLVHTIFEHTMNREPMAHEKAEYDALWQGLAGENYSVDAMIHRLVDTKIFGGIIQ